jgi:hypothetical protein
MVLKVYEDYMILQNKEGDYFMIPFTHIKFIKTANKGKNIDWIVFTDNSQIPG